MALSWSKGLNTVISEIAIRVYKCCELVNVSKYVEMKGLIKGYIL